MRCLGYAKYANRNQQELYYFSRMAMRVYTELGALAATSGAAQKYCLAKEVVAGSDSAARLHPRTWFRTIA